METVDLKLVLLGASRRTHPGPALAWRGAPAVRVAPRASGCSGSLHAVRSCAVGSPHPPPPSCLSSAQASRAWERPAWSTATCTTPSARPFRRALACRRASRPQQPAPPPRHTGPANPVTVTRLPPACHLADHRGVVRDEEGGGQRQNLQPRHLGHCRPGARLDSSRPRSTLLGLHVTLLWLHSLYYGSSTVAARALLYSGSTHSPMAPQQ